MPLDRARLIKFMMMTTSSNDAEALVALRKANALLAADNFNWNELISGKAQQPVPRPPPRPPMRPAGRGTSEIFSSSKKKFTDPDIPRMIGSLLRDTKGGFRDFVVKMDEAWSTYGYLTGPQYDVILSAYERMK